MGYRGLKPGTDGFSGNERSVQGRTTVEPLQRAERGGALRKKKAWEEEEQHLRTLRDVRDLLARGPPAYEDSDTEQEWREREGMMRQRETLQKFSHWICADKASKSLDGREFASLGGPSPSRAGNGSEMCRKIYDRERERCEVINGAMVNRASLPRESHDKSGPNFVHRNHRTF